MTLKPEFAYPASQFWVFPHLLLKLMVKIVPKPSSPIILTFLDTGKSAIFVKMAVFKADVQRNIRNVAPEFRLSL